LPEPNNDPVKLYREITERPMINKTAIIEKVKNEGDLRTILKSV
jgi:hypothetical protein